MNCLIPFDYFHQTVNKHTGSRRHFRLFHLRLGPVVLLENPPEHESALPTQHHSQRPGKRILLPPGQSQNG